MLTRLLKKFKWLVMQLLTCKLLVHVFSFIFREIARSGRNSTICLKYGFLPVPVNFYSPIPDIQDLKERQIWDKKSDLAGISFHKQKQFETLKTLSQFANECQWPQSGNFDKSDFFLNNPSFSYGCAASTHCFIRFFKPTRILEIGSGMSSKVISHALMQNARENSKTFEYAIIDPFPGNAVVNGKLSNSRLIQKRVEFVSLETFDDLSDQDILFIDSSHSVKIGSDVNFLILEVLPRLKPGVIVHFHDISLPFEYSPQYATNEGFRQFWTEQYLLQAFLCLNKEFEILLAMHSLLSEDRKIFSDFFPAFALLKDPPISGSFWIRRKK